MVYLAANAFYYLRAVIDFDQFFIVIFYTEQGGEVHEYPNAYGSGARTFVGFTG